MTSIGILEEVLLIAVASSFERSAFTLDKSTLKKLFRDSSDLIHVLRECIDSSDLCLLDEMTFVPANIKDKLFVLCDDGYLADAVAAGDAMEIAPKGWRFLDHLVHKPFYEPLITDLPESVKSILQNECNMKLLPSRSE